MGNKHIHLLLLLFIYYYSFIIHLILFILLPVADQLNITQYCTDKYDILAKLRRSLITDDDNSRKHDLPDCRSCEHLTI